MKSVPLVVRAIGAEFARRLLLPLIIAGIFVALLLHILGGWLVTQNAWWWLLESVFVLGTLIFVVLVTTARLAIRMFAPSQTERQRDAVRAYVDKLQRVSDVIGTPKFILLFYIVRDIFRPRADGFIATTSQDSKTLHSDFLALLRMF